jgi:hypothetical protein
MVLVRVYLLSSKPRQRSAKLDLKSPAPLINAKLVSPVTVLLANPEMGVILRKAHVSQLKPYVSAA